MLTPFTQADFTATAPMPPEFAEVAKMLDQDAPPREVIPRNDDAPRFERWAAISTFVSSPFILQP